MSDNVIDLPVITSLKLPAERILKAALKSDMSDAVVIGYDKDGKFYFSSTIPDGGEVLWLLELTKRKLLEAAE